MATMQDVATKAGVSIATVSHVINGTRSVAKRTTARVEQAMEELDYRPNAVAQSLRTRRTHAIAAVVSDITNPFFSTIIRGLEDAANEEGYSLIVCNSDESPEKEERQIRLLRRRQVDGLVVSPVGDGSNTIFRDLLRSEIPLVFVDRRSEDIHVDAVLSENIEGAEFAVRHLIQKGHTRIGLILGTKGSTTTEERLLGYREVLSEAGVPFEDVLVKWGGYRKDGGRQATAELLSMDEPPTALFSTNNLMTVGVLQELAHQGLTVPRDMALVSFDDLSLGELLTPPLSAVLQDPYKLGSGAFSILLERMKPGGSEVKVRIRVIRIPIEFKKGGST